MMRWWKGAKRNCFFCFIAFSRFSFVFIYHIIQPFCLLFFNLYITIVPRFLRMKRNKILKRSALKHVVLFIFFLFIYFLLRIIKFAIFFFMDLTKIIKKKEFIKFENKIDKRKDFKARHLTCYSSFLSELLGLLSFLYFLIGNSCFHEITLITYKMTVWHVVILLHSVGAVFIKDYKNILIDCKANDLWKYSANIFSS